MRVLSRKGENEYCIYQASRCVERNQERKNKKKEREREKRMEVIAITTAGIKHGAKMILNDTG
jgi:hypothetical protein